jgi:hypothetical protein
MGAEGGNVAAGKVGESATPGPSIGHSMHLSADG